MAGQYDRIVQPGQSGKIPVTVSTRRGGKLKKSITVYTNIPGNNGPVRLSIQGEIWQPVDVKPYGARFGRLTPDAAKSESLVRKLMIVNNMESDAQLTDVRISNPSFQAQTRVIEQGKKYELTISVVSPLPEGNNSGTVQLSTGVKEMPTLSVPVSAYVMTDVDVNPKELTLTSDRPSDLKRQFIVRNNTKQPLELSYLEASDCTLAVAVEEMRPGRMFKITVDVPTAYHAPPGGDKITFNTNIPSAPTITIPVRDPNYSRRAKARAARHSSDPGLRSSVSKPTPQPSAATGAEHEAEKKPATGSVKPKKAEPSGG